MKFLGLVVVCALLWAVWPNLALAGGSGGNDCSACHGSMHGGPVVDNSLLDVVEHDTWADPTETGVAIDQGILKVFQVVPDATKSLFVEISGLNHGDEYAVQITVFEKAGVENGGTLDYSGDVNWTAQQSHVGEYFTVPDDGEYEWGEDPTRFQFDIYVDASTPIDYYDLEFAVTGKYDTGGSMFYGGEHFYLQVIPEPATLAILAIGFAGAAISARRRRKV